MKAGATVPRAPQPLLFQVWQPVVWNASSPDAMVTVVGPAVLPLAMISLNSPDVPRSLAQ